MFNLCSNFEPDADLGSNRYSRRFTGIGCLLVCNKKSNSTSSTTQQTLNSQVGVGNAAQDSTQIGIGSNASVASGAGAIQAENSTINVTNADTGLVAQIGDQLTATANNSIVAQQKTVKQALGFGKEAMQIANTSLITGQKNVASALGFGKEALANVSSISMQGQQEAQAANYAAQQTTQSLADKLANIVANTVPQTAAAQSQISQGINPADVTAGSGILPASNTGKIVVLLGGIAAAVAIFKPAFAKKVLS